MDSLPLDHVGVAVPSIEEAAPLFELITGHARSPVEEIDAQGVDVCFVGPVELLQPRAADTPVGRFLERRGPGLHHLAFRTTDIRGDLERLREEGVELVDTEPRPGARGHLVAFLHPRSTAGVLLELVEEG